MASTLKVDTIQNISSGNTAMTIDTSGDINVTNADLDWYQLKSHHTTNNTVLGTISNGWGRVSSSSPHFFTKIGTGVTNSSGVFSFPRAGVWQITLELQFQSDVSDGSAGVAFQTSTDSGNNFSDYRFLFMGADSTTDIYKQASGTAMLNITSSMLSTFRFQLKSNSLAANGKFVADGTNPYTSIMFERKYPAQ